MKWFRKYLEWIGFGKEELEEITKEKYIPIRNKSMAERYLKYVEEIFNYHRDRKQIIENKNSLLIGQVSIVISIVALFIPLFNDQLTNYPLWVTIPLIFIFIFIIFHYGLTLLFAITNLEIHKRKFSVGRTSTITKPNRVTTETDFINVQVSDLVYAINFNNQGITKIGDSLIFAGRNFKIANFTFLGLTVILVFILLLVPKQKVEKDPLRVKVENFLEIPCFNKKDSVVNNLTENISLVNSVSINNRIDIQNIKIDSLINKINILISITKKCNLPKKPHKPKPKCPCPCP